MIYQPAFPTELAEYAVPLLAALRVDEQFSATQGFVVDIQSQALSAPSRVYYSIARLRSQIGCSSGETRILALCLGTRHCDGFFREECIHQLIGFDRPWVIPFLVQLLGEYVIEIVDVIFEALPYFNRVAYCEFAHANPTFIATAKRRAISYWDCYYRTQFGYFRDYPGFLAIEQIERWV